MGCVVFEIRRKKPAPIQTPAIVPVSRLPRASPFFDFSKAPARQNQGEPKRDLTLLWAESKRLVMNTDAHRFFYPTHSQRRDAFPAWALGSRLAVLGLAVAALALTGCCSCNSGSRIKGSGQTVARQYELTGFSRIEAGAAFQLNVRQGEHYSIALTVDDNLVEHLDVSASGDILHIGLKPNLSVQNATLRADVTLPALAALNLSGATQTTIAGFSSDQPLQFELSGASHLLGTITNGDGRISLSGASRVDLEGSARTLKVKASGASHADLDRYTSLGTSVEASGASHVTVNASGRLEVKASGASAVRYVGSPAGVHSEASGASSIRRK
jgi:hypothetical protein